MVALALLLLIAFEGSYRIVADVDPEFASGEPQSISLEEMGLLDYVPEHVRATRMFTRRLRRLTRKQSQATRLMNLHSGRMQNTADANQKQRIAIQVAKIIDGQNDELTQALPILREQSTRFTSALQGFVTSSEIQTPADLEALQTLRASTVLFVANLNGSHRAVTGWRAATVGLRGRNVSAAINRACDTMERLLGDYVALYLQIESSEGGILKAMDRRLLEAPSG